MYAHTYYVYKFVGNSIKFKYSPQGVTMNTVKCFFKIYKICIQCGVNSILYSVQESVSVEIYDHYSYMTYLYEIRPVLSAAEDLGLH